MIHTVSAEGFDLTPKLQKYATAKVRTVEKYVPRHDRQAAALAVHFKMAKKGEEKTCTLALELPLETLAVRETSAHMYSSLDAATIEMRRKIADYKSKHSKYGIRHHLIRHLKRSKVTV